MKATVLVKKIRFQPDEFETRKGALVDADALAEGKEKDALLDHFKRFIVDGEIVVDGRAWTYRIIISLRGHIATFTSQRGCPVTPYGLFWCWERELFDWNHRRHAKDRDEQRPLLPVSSDGDNPIVATIRDGYWFADVLHHLRDMGGFETDVPETFRPARFYLG